MTLNRLKKVLFLFWTRRRFPSSNIHSSSSVCGVSLVGDHSAIFSNVHVLRSTIGKFTYVQENSEIVDSELGSYCSIAKNVLIGLSEHPINQISTSPVFYDNSQPLPKFLVQTSESHGQGLKTFIGPDVWIGANAIIKAGVRIGVGAVIGAGSVVTNDVDPYSIVAGVPGREIKKRFDVTICNALLESKWWQLDEEFLISLAEYFRDPIIFLNHLGFRDDK